MEYGQDYHVNKELADAIARMLDRFLEKIVVSWPQLEHAFYERLTKRSTPLQALQAAQQLLPGDAANFGTTDLDALNNLEPDELALALKILLQARETKPELVGPNFLVRPPLQTTALILRRQNAEGAALRTAFFLAAIELITKTHPEEQAELLELGLQYFGPTHSNDMQALENRPTYAAAMQEWRAKVLGSVEAAHQTPEICRLNEQLKERGARTAPLRRESRDDFGKILKIPANGK